MPRALEGLAALEVQPLEFVQHMVQRYRLLQRQTTQYASELVSDDTLAAPV